MKYKKLGDTGLLVSELCLGTMTFGGKGIWTHIGAIEQGPVGLNSGKSGPGMVRAGRSDKAQEVLAGLRGRYLFRRLVRNHDRKSC